MRCFDRNVNENKGEKFWIVISESCVTMRETHFSNSLTNNFEYELTVNGNAKTIFCFRFKNRDLQIRF